MHQEPGCNASYLLTHACALPCSHVPTSAVTNVCLHTAVSRVKKIKKTKKANVS